MTAVLDVLRTIIESLAWGLLALGLLAVMGASLIWPRELLRAWCIRTGRWVRPWADFWVLTWLLGVGGWGWWIWRSL